ILLKPVLEHLRNLFVYSAEGIPRQ
ncbi:unnamed protein product, partial [Oikopleura dioica]